MPYCTKCHDEFQDWVKVCPDCNVALVDKLPNPPKRKKRNESLIHIATASNEPMAQMWSEILAEHDIHCLLKNCSGAAAYGLTNDVPIRIHVLAPEVEKAVKILAPFLKD